MFRAAIIAIGAANMVLGSGFWLCSHHADFEWVKKGHMLSWDFSELMPENWRALLGLCWLLKIVVV